MSEYNIGCHNNQADQYDKKVLSDLGDYIRENYFEVLDRVIECSGIKENLKVLNIGIGTGLLEERIKSQAHLFGIDISEKMMEKVREKKLPVTLMYGSFTDIPFENAVFDRIVSTFAFHHLTPQEKKMAFAEMDRVLCGQGRIVIGDFMFLDKAQLQELVDKFTVENRKDMLEELEEEYFTNISEEMGALAELGYDIKYERISTLSWVITAYKI